MQMYEVTALAPEGSEEVYQAVIFADGLNAWYADMYNYCRQIGIMYSDTYSDKESRKLIYVAYNMHWENYALALPKIEGRNGFEVVLKSCDKKENIYIDS